MKNIAVINGFGMKPYAFEQLGTGPAAWRRTLSYAESLPSVESVVVIAEQGSPAAGRYATRAQGAVPFRITEEPAPFTVERFAELLAGFGESFDNLFYLYADTPFLDGDVTGRMYRNHLEYHAEYSFADGYPYGLAPEIFRTDMLPAFRKLASGNRGSVYRDTVFTVIQKDINAFDIETEISPVDQRLLRLSFTCDSKSGFELVNRFFAENARTADDVVRLAGTKPELLRTYPAFVNVQISGGCPQACSYCPFPSFGGDILADRRFMPAEKFASILDSVVSFSGEAVISVSLWGEPSLHPDIVRLVREVMDRDGLSLVVETSGLGWKREDLEAVLAMPRQPLAWIVSLDSIDGPLYGRLRGDGFEEAVRAADMFRELFPGRVWVQAVRMTSNEDHLESFYKQYRESGVIIQKYDHFCGRLPERKVTDLSPVNRFPCWHLKRDLTVLLDGTVPMCREDTGRDHVFGNVFTDPLELIWERAAGPYRDHIGETYPDICRKCDEYYTYNF